MQMFNDRKWKKTILPCIPLNIAAFLHTRAHRKAATFRGMYGRIPSYLGPEEGRYIHRDACMGEFNSENDVSACLVALNHFACYVC